MARNSKEQPDDKYDLGPRGFGFSCTSSVGVDTTLPNIYKYGIMPGLKWEVFLYNPLYC